jgi:hypothetical protein
MQIVVNHLTRMQPGFICVAGLAVDRGEHVRPVTRAGRLTTRLLARNGGPFDLGAIVDLGPTRPVGRPPETEDHAFEPRHARRVGQMPPDEFWDRLQSVSATRLWDLFGRDLTPRGNSTCAVDLGKGLASLGCLVPTGSPELYVRPRPGRPAQVRLKLTDGRFPLDLGVTDIRLYAADHITPDDTLVERVAWRLRGGLGVVLAVGLGRATGGSPDYPPLHWLQVNSLHLEDDPAWQLG